MSRVGVVTIGRNEGERLIQCLDSLVAQRSQTLPIVYVDSGSTDGSQAAAEARGVDVVALDLSIPFTAARARNAGFDHLRQNYPDLDYIQFFDGDCEVLPGWIAAAAAVMDQHVDVVAVCGWRRERYPERSPYNRICDVEWHMGAIGEITCFGGDVMIRASALASVGGYNPGVVAAEDDELGVRLRQTGGRLVRIDRHSTIHDADIHSVGQWWQRAKRCGYAYAQVSSMHGRSPEYKFVKEVKRSLLWGAIIPLISLILTIPTYGLSLLVFGRYPLTAVKTIQGTKKRGFSWADSIPWGISCALSSFPEAFGVVKFYLTRLSKRQHEIIEYKGAKVEG